MQVDAVVLDIDGVLVDVGDSYRRAIIESVDRVCGKTIDRDTVQAFKDAGGFNNDWELTDAAALYVLARREGLGMDPDAFTDRVAEAGGGLSAAKAVVGDLPRVAQARVRDHCTANWRAGSRRCRRRGTSTTSRRSSTPRRSPTSPSGSTSAC